MSRVVLLTGGNTPEIDKNIHKVRELINKELGTIIQTSSIYESEPWGFQATHHFLNQIIIIDTRLLPEELLFKIWDIERRFGRSRGTAEEEKLKYQKRLSGKTPVYKSRTMDIDILFYDSQIIHTPLLNIPHPLIPFRNFVLIPLKEILPDFIHPILNKPIKDIDC